MMDGYIGMPFEDLINAVEYYGWEMDELYVSPDGGKMVLDRSQKLGCR